MAEVYCDEVIISRQLRRGTGQNKLSPIRIVTQVFQKDGQIIAEYDPSPELFTIEQMIDFAAFIHRGGEPIESNLSVWFHQSKWADNNIKQLNG